jgi:hypothetical protein
MRFKYDITSKCCGCDLEKQTRKVDNLDPRHPELNNFICRSCDKSTKTISKIMDQNTKLYGSGDIFGLKKGNRVFSIIGE